jgi:hypothetical protein
MSRQWRECEVVIEILLDAGLRIDEIDEASLREREGTFAKGDAGRVAALPTAVTVEPVLEVLAVESVAGVGKSGREAAVAFDHVPPDVIDMQMSAEDEIDALGLNASAFELAEVARGQSVEG